MPNLDENLQYTFEVRAVNAIGEGAVASVSTGDATPTGDLPFTPAEQPNLSFPADTQIESITLPMATGGTGTITYSISALPDGLTLDRATRMLSGTPTTVAATTVTYTATDAAGARGTLTFTITVTAAGTVPTTGPTGAAPTFSSAGFRPGSAEVTITISEPVWGGGNAVLATSFAIQGDVANAATSRTRCPWYREQCQR